MELKFGIPTLDDLIIPPYESNPSPKTSDSNIHSIAILGPDGTGKSVMALHMASRYAADCLSEPNLQQPRILYVSSDLQYDNANQIWNNFKLGEPNRRHIPFERNDEAAARFLREKTGGLLLSPLKPEYLVSPTADNHPGIVDFLTSNTRHIGFIDLASRTAGDDWMFVNLLLVKLQSIPCVNGRKHMVIIDSVEGFETFVGKFDAYGNEQTRRSRVAQSIRNSTPNVKLMFVVEEPKSAEHLPEEYVTDVVLRLRKRPQAGNTILTVEVQKSRSREHAKGEHPFEIRAQQGTSTGPWQNADTPVAGNAYVQVFYTPALRSRFVSASPGFEETQSPTELATFGLKYLDELLPTGKRGADSDCAIDEIGGLRAGTATALIGDPATGKSILGIKFLAQGLEQAALNFLHLFMLAKNFEQYESKQEVRKAFVWTHFMLSQATQCGECDQGSLSRKARTAIHSKMTENGWKEALVQAAIEGDKASNKILASQNQNLDSNRAAYRLAMVPTSQVNQAKCRDRWSIEIKADTQLNDLLCHPNLVRPSLLLTTSDHRGKEVSELCFEQLTPSLRAALSALNIPAGEIDELLHKDGNDLLRAQLVSLLDNHLIVRRFDLQSVPGAIVFEVIRRNLNEANKLIFGLAYPPRQQQRYLKAGRIRLVIDDLRVLTRINPEIVKDGAFLPFLMFMLERSGVTSLIVHTDNLRPNTPPEDEASRALLSVLKRAILTWNVPFEGKSRIAVGVIVPHRNPEKNGLVRELTLNNDSPNVTRRFELYSGIEDGRPVSVPLAVYIYKETPAFADYVEEENRLLRELFASAETGTPVEPGRVVFPIEQERYLALRDYTHLDLDAQDSHTMIFQVDEYWALREPHILDRLESYLSQELPGKSDINAHTLEDPFRLFFGDPLDVPSDGSGKWTRKDYFKNAGYLFRHQPKHTGCSRIPFMWDFGFLMLRRSPWEMAAGLPLFALMKKADLGKADTQERAVIQRAIPFADSNGDRSEEVVGKVHSDLGAGEQGASWRKFFGSCKRVAEFHDQQTGTSTLPFDIASSSPETMNSFLLEMWLSEIKLEIQLLCDDTERWRFSPKPTLSKEGKLNLINLTKLLTTLPDGTQLSDRARIGERFQWIKEQDATVASSWSSRRKTFRSLPLGAFCLYKVWLLMLEVIPFDAFLNPDDPFALSSDRVPSIHSVASRHWYKTACTFSNDLYRSSGVHDSLIVGRLAGSYSTRGDWYLGTPKSSRSKLLGQNAIDLFSSRRANITRLQKGLGLPVRDIVQERACREMRTALRGQIVGDLTDWGISSQVSYGDLSSLGAGKEGSTGANNFDWLWRSEIHDYDRISRPLHKWMVRVFHWTNDYKARHLRNWRAGFAAYDELTCKVLSQVREFDSFVAFGDLCDDLVEELLAAER